MKDVKIAIVSVKYGDYLALTLPRTREVFSDVTILSSERDYESQALARSNECDLFLTEIWNVDGCSFNKAGGINEWLNSLYSKSVECWILLLDADILFAAGFSFDVRQLDKAMLYSVRRRLCPVRQEFLEFVNGRRSLTDFAIDVPPVVDGKVWGSVPSANPAALCGYFQMWWHSADGVKRSLPRSRNAAGYDVCFGITFEDANRAYLPDNEVLHLGPCKTNWNGRASSRWGCEL